jgi:hypothetical protein
LIDFVAKNFFKNIYLFNLKTLDYICDKIIDMIHSVIDLKKYRRAMGYGDFKAVKLRLEAKGVNVSKTAITQVLQEVYYNQTILDEVASYLAEPSTPKEGK